MAENLGTDFDFQGAGRPAKYDWPRWLNGDVWKLTPEDCPDLDGIENLRSAAYNAARRRNLTLKTRVKGDKLWIQAIHPAHT